MKNIRLFEFLLLLLLAALPSFAVTAPWISPNDKALRANIQFLADTGVINIPVTTYPMMWQSVATAINAIDTNELTSTQSAALTRVKSKLQKATGSDFSNKASIKIGNQVRPFTSFGSTDFEKNKLSLSSEYIGNDFAGKVQLNSRVGINRMDKDQSIDFDGSYLAYKLGDWVLAAGAIESWWGATYDTSLIMSNNAGPQGAVSIRRNDSKAFDSPWLSWIGPWTFTAQIAQLEHNRFIADTKMWSSRATFKPYSKLELGLAWSYQWGGKDQLNSFENFVRGLLGQTECPNGESTCDPSLESKLGNQLAGYDFRWADTIASHPYAFYAQTIGEDSSGSGIFSIADKSYIFGLETQFSAFEQRLLINLEYTDTQASCGAEGDTSQDCFYEHTIYRSGYRYHRRSIGSTYDNDAETLVLTVFGQQANGNNWQIKLRDLELNTNNRDRYPSDLTLGNTITKQAEQVSQVEIQYQFSLRKGALTLGATISNSSLKNSYLSDDIFNLQYEIEL